MYVASLPSEPFAAAAIAPTGHNRAHGSIDLRFGRRGTVRTLFQMGAARVLFPRTAIGPEAVLVNTAGGITGGDTFDYRIVVDPGAGALVTTQAAEKLYRSAGDDGRIRTRLSVGSRGWLAWLPQETILFEGSRLRRDTAIEVAPGGRALACETIVFGRQARGEAMRTGLLHDSWTVTRGGKLAWADVLNLHGDVAAALARPAVGDGAVAYATVLYVADNVRRWLDAARDLVGCAHITAAATAMGEVLLARFAADTLYALRRELTAFLTQFLRAVRLPVGLPHVWSS